MNLYYAAESNQAVGPITEDQLHELYRGGSITLDSLIIIEGETEWKQYRTFVQQNPPRHGINFSQTSSNNIAPQQNIGVSVSHSRTETLAIWSLVLGIISCFGVFLTAIPAVICGHIAKRKIQTNSNLTGAGIASAGLITGYIGCIFYLLAFIQVSEKSEVAKQLRAEAEIAAMSAALESFKVDTGDYPRSADYPNVGLSSKSLFGILSQANSKAYYEFSESMKSTKGITDPYGKPYGYTYPGSEQRNGAFFYDMWSTGRSGSKENESRWIKNW